MTSVRPRKTKRSVSLDVDLVETVGDDNLSSVLNTALRAQVATQRRQAALGALIDELVDVVGPPDEIEVARYMVLLGGPDDVSS